MHTPTPAGCSCTDGRACTKPGKHPRVLWSAGQRVGVGQLVRWWRRWPAANVGIVTGAVSDLLVVDVDGRHGGYESLAELERIHGHYPTMAVATGGGGRHLYYRNREGVTIQGSAGKLRPGMDIRADRGLVVAPPSLHASGNRYRRANTLVPAACAEWLVAALGPPAPTPRRAVPVGAGHGRYGRDALEGELATLAGTPPGSRNYQLNRSAYLDAGLMVVGGDGGQGAPRMAAGWPVAIVPVRRGPQQAFGHLGLAQYRSVEDRLVVGPARSGSGICGWSVRPPTLYSDDVCQRHAPRSI
jgi:hypothetical protein